MDDRATTLISHLWLKSIIPCQKDATVMLEPWLDLRVCQCSQLVWVWFSFTCSLCGYQSNCKRTSITYNLVRYRVYESRLDIIKSVVLRLVNYENNGYLSQISRRSWK